MRRLMLRRGGAIGLSMIVLAVGHLAPAIASSATKLKPNTSVVRPTRDHGTGHGRALISSGAMVSDASCEANTLPANDDGSTSEITLPFTLNYFGKSYSSLWVNNNGNVTFSAPLSTYTPFEITSSTPPIITQASGPGRMRGPISWERAAFRSRRARSPCGARCLSAPG